MNIVQTIVALVIAVGFCLSFSVQSLSQSATPKKGRKSVLIKRKPNNENGKSSLNGIIVDDYADARVPGVSIKIAKKGKKQTTGLASGDAGEFSIKPLSPGNYRITFEAIGFRPIEIANLKISDKEHVWLKLTLTVSGDMNEHCNCCHALIVIIPSKVQISTKLDFQKLEKLPHPMPLRSSNQRLQIFPN